MQIFDINLDALPDLVTRQIVIQLLNLIEALAAEHGALRIENQHLRDEHARLKGQSAKPDIKPPTPPSAPPTDHSSEAERRTPSGKPKKNASLTVTREERRVVDLVTLPADAEPWPSEGLNYWVHYNSIPELRATRHSRGKP
ncbi:hypothetical protein [Candidatus Chloroploca sp. Khr17]|uniref:hypothetical protein n=1 Tax=Candidatus Chloroploca sp. Khr17 TaxID=2496869 RepID=UPI00101E1CC5|nr:hypothetical protein [Candidatus Chloroploca sp. Khr17]